MREGKEERVRGEEEEGDDGQGERYSSPPSLPPHTHLCLPTDTHTHKIENLNNKKGKMTHLGLDNFNRVLC